MRPGDLAIVKCNRKLDLLNKVVLLLEWQRPEGLLKRRRWLCLVDGVQRSIKSDWLEEIK